MSSLRILPMAMLWTLATWIPAAGQATARGQVRLVIRPVLHLETATTEAGLVASGNGWEARGAVRVRVSANAPWRLVVRTRGDRGERDGNDSGRGHPDPADAVWVRANPGTSGFARSLARDYTPLSSGRLTVAEGSPGADQEIVLDYRWRRDGSWEGGEVPENLVVELAER